MLAKEFPDQMFEPSDDLDRLERLEKQIAQDVLDKKGKAIYDCSEVYCLMEGDKGELRERDQKIKDLESVLEQTKVNFTDYVEAVQEDLNGCDSQIAQSLENKPDLSPDEVWELSALTKKLKEQHLQILRLNHDYNESIDEYKREIEELKTRIHKDFIELQVRGIDLEYKDREIEERDRQIAQLQTELLDRDRINSLYKGHVASFDQVSKELGERDRQIAQLQTELLDRAFLNFFPAFDQVSKELGERDRQILRLNHDYNESTDEYKREIEERDQDIRKLRQENQELRQLISLQEGNHVYDNLVEQLETASRRFVSIRRSVRELYKNLKDTRVHLNSLHIDMGLLGSWSKNWDKEETAFTTLTHHEKNKLASIKAIQLKHLEDITEKNLKELSKVFEMVKTDDNDNDALDEIPF